MTRGRLPSPADGLRDDLGRILRRSLPDREERQAVVAALQRHAQTYRDDHRGRNALKRAREEEKRLLEVMTKAVHTITSALAALDHEFEQSWRHGDAERGNRGINGSLRAHLPARTTALVRDLAAWRDETEALLMPERRPGQRPEDHRLVLAVNVEMVLLKAGLRQSRGRAGALAQLLLTILAWAEGDEAPLTVDGTLKALRAEPLSGKRLLAISR